MLFSIAAMQLLSTVSAQTVQGTSDSTDILTADVLPTSLTPLPSIPTPVCGVIDKSQLPGAEEPDCGPYTETFCQYCAGNCATPEDSDVKLVDPGRKDPGIKLSRDELDIYKSIELEYIKLFAQKPMPFDLAVSVPFCPVNTSSTMAMPVKKRGIKIGGTVILADRPEKVEVKRPYCVPDFIAIPIHFNVYTTNATTQSIVTRDSLQRQVDQMNTAFGPMGIEFQTGQIIYYVGNEWRGFTKQIYESFTKERLYAEKQQEAIRIRHRIPEYDQMTITVVEQIEEYDCSVGTRTAGFCSYPTTNRDRQQSDGCVIDIDSLPGIAFRKSFPGQGTTLTHEAGHWFGLKHLFNAVGCDGGDSDGISDTEKYSFDSRFKPDQARCSDNNIVDKVTNYMSYTSIQGQVIGDAKPWTKGQRAAAYTSFYVIRRGLGGTVNCNDRPVFFEQPTRLTWDYKRDLGRRQQLFGRDALDQPAGYIDKVLQACLSDDNQIIDPITGEISTLPRAPKPVDPPVSNLPVPPKTDDPPVSNIPVPPKTGDPPITGNPPVTGEPPNTGEPVRVPETGGVGPIVNPPGGTGGTSGTSGTGNTGNTRNTGSSGTTGNTGMTGNTGTGPGPGAGSGPGDNDPGVLTRTTIVGGSRSTRTTAVFVTAATGAAAVVRASGAEVLDVSFLALGFGLLGNLMAI